VLEVIDRERPPVEVPCERCTVYCRACARRVLKPHNNCPKGARMQALSRLQNLLAVANWYGRALMFPQTHPLELEAISLYTSRYGATPDGPDSAPWCYQQNPEDVTPQNWHPPLTVPVGSFYDPRTGEVYPYGVQPANNLDPTSPAFVEPPQIA
jgi:hypothetical protein